MAWIGNFLGVYAGFTAHLFWHMTILWCRIIDLWAWERVVLALLVFVLYMERFSNLSLVPNIGPMILVCGRHWYFDLCQQNNLMITVVPMVLIKISATISFCFAHTVSLYSPRARIYICTYACIPTITLTDCALYSDQPLLQAVHYTLTTHSHRLCTIL